MATPERELDYGAIEVYSEEILGIGSYGKVCKAKCGQLPCAAKLLHDTMFGINNPGVSKFMEQFEQECQFLRMIKHPNIVQFLGTERDPQSRRLALLTELMDESLTGFLGQSGGGLLYHTQLNICHDVALALAYLHSNNIIHRDLSSNNVLLIGEGIRAKVTDFGMSKLIGMNPRMTPAQTLCPGTPAYMPPEALITPPRYSNKLDCFSHGVLAIQIVTRQFPNPTDATTTIEDARSPTGTLQLPVPERQRRKKDIDLVGPNHPLLPVALHSLKDRDTERPSADELCGRLATLKGEQMYTRSMEQSRERDTPLQTLHGQLQQKDSELERVRSNYTTEIQQYSNKIQQKSDELETAKAELHECNTKLQECSTKLQECQRELTDKESTIEKISAALAALEAKTQVSGQAYATGFRPWQGGPMHSRFVRKQSFPVAPRGGMDRPQGVMPGQKTVRNKLAPHNTGVFNPSAKEFHPSAQVRTAGDVQATPTTDIVQMLAQAEPQKQKQIIGEQLYRQIYTMHPEPAGKITGMLLEMANSELLHMLEAPESLKAKVEEAVAQIKPAPPSAQVPTARNVQATPTTDIVQMLAQAEPQQQKQIIGEQLYRQIYTMYPEPAGKITGMLLKMDNSELLHMLEAPESLKAKVEEVVTQMHRNKPAPHNTGVFNPSAKAFHPSARVRTARDVQATRTTDIVQMLAQADPQQQKQIIGEQLYRQIYTMHPEPAGKITGMLLEMANSELLHMLEVPESLKAKVEEAVAQIKPAPPSAQVPTARNVQATPTTDIVQMLAQAEPQQQKQIIGEQLYRQIYTMYPEPAGKITGMLLEMDNSKLLGMLEAPESLKAKVEEVVSVLNESQISNTSVQAPTIPTAAENYTAKKKKKRRQRREN